jgi:Flp pilus assembly protein protease CpaA
MMFTLCSASVLAVLLRIGLIDWRCGYIGNRDVAVIAVASTLCFALSTPLDFIGLFISCAAALALTLPGFLFGQVGGGDVKLLCALAPLWHGLELLSIFVCGVLLLGPLLMLSAALHTRGDRARELPLGTAMLLGSLPWFLSGVFNRG